MAADSFPDATLLIVGHGSEESGGSSAPVYQQAAWLRERRLFAQVQEAFWKQEPQLVAVIERVRTPRLFIVPLLVSDGYFSRQVIPRALGLCRADGSAFAPIAESAGRRLYYCDPVGTHPGITEVVLARAAEVVRNHPFPRAPQPAEIALFVAGHGTERHDQSRRASEQQVAVIRARSLYAEVHAVFLEETPRIAECYQLARVRNLVVVPFLISEGPHAAQDIPVLLGEDRERVAERVRRGQSGWRNPTERNSRLVWYSASVGTHPSVAEIILARVREMAERSPAVGR
jgi:sirohydrochlorin cobaltochelatase